MDALTAKTNEIRRLHAVCREKDEQAKSWLRKTVAEARYSQHRMIQERRKLTPNHAFYYQQERDRYLYAAHVVWHILTNEWKGSL